MRESLSNLQSCKAVNSFNLNRLDHFMYKKCGPMPNLMVALPNIGGALCSTPQSLADAHY